MSTKKTAFIVYATEDYDLTKDFVDKFRIYNPTLTLFYDKNPYSDNIDKQLIGYAKTCDIAIILTSQRLMSEEHYSNENELPVLIKRRKRNEVALVGIRLRDTNVNEWNKDAEIPFFQLRYADLRRSRRDDEYGAMDNSEFAVYELIEKNDRSTYHKKLKEWVDEVLKKKEMA